jgi:hypothetical protein
MTLFMDVLHKSVWVLAAVWVVLGPGDGRGAFEPIHRASPPPNLEPLVKNAVWNELQARKRPSARFEYREIDESAGHSTASTEIETPEGVVSKEIEENGEPLTDDERSRNQHQLQKLVRSPRLQHELLESQQEETQRRTGLLKDFPSAFLFQFDGVEPNGAVRLNSRPNHRFQPPL